MSLLQNTMAKSGTANFYNGVATTSLRLDKASSAVLIRDPSSTGDVANTMTFSFWVKRATLGSQYIYSS